MEANSQQSSQNSQNSLNGTKTEQNLHTALSAEAQAYLRYIWFSKKAAKDGYIEISHIFEQTAANEKEHAEIWFNLLGGLSSTERNLAAAANGEHFEWSDMYAEFARVAHEEGLCAAAALFEKIASIEKTHEERYLSYLNDVKNGNVFKSDNMAQKWVCLNCGYIYVGNEPPKICPVCSHAQGYFTKQN